MPPYTQQDDLCLKMTPFEGMLLSHRESSFALFPPR
jgi:hypothetical protein